MRILLFSPKGAGDHYYGPGINAYRMYKHLDPGSEISLNLAHGYRDQQEYDIFDTQYFISDIVNKNLYLGVKFLYLAKKWVKKNAHKFDVVHCLTAFHHSFMFSLWFEQEGVPVFIKIGQSSYTGFSENSLQSKILGLNRFRKNHANDITGYVSISSLIRENLMKAGIEPDRIHSIPNGVNTDVFSPVNEEKKKQIREQLKLPDRFTIIFTGAFGERKNPLLIAKAFQHFGNRDDIQLLLIGPDLDGGEQRADIQDLIRANKMGNIFVKDFVDDIAPCYQASDLFVLPSTEEGFSNSMLEAQSCGLPAIVTRISGSEDLIDEKENGTFIEVDELSIYEAMKEYFFNEEKHRKHSAGARKKILEKYSSQKVLNQYLDLFARVVS